MSSMPLSADASIFEASLFDRVWLVGCGAMAGALLERWLISGLDAARVTIIDPEPAGLPQGFTGPVVPEPPEGVAPTLLILGIKPQILPQLAPILSQRLAGQGVLLSMLAGVRTATLSALFPGAPVMRIMPNLSARIGRGTTAMFASGLAPADADAIDGLLRSAGSTLWLEDEGRFDAVTAVSGSGPAFLFRFIEALAGAGEAAGLDPETAARLALETVAGAAEMAALSGLSPAALRQQVTSPNGTTQAGLDVLDGDGSLSSLMRATVRAATERSRALASAADAAIEAAAGRETMRAA
ncbi:pyrroline-5-carboxylate reductase [Sandaracinobacteroides sp. A072]|uniref:pyrroline-5-carboxylate reductase n=1 Tax=Sandaracinobacteroides sp. A072 TaxID=3461146 RepID=UPI0040414511